jgi:hypothetical protein
MRATLHRWRNVNVFIAILCLLAAVGAQARSTTTTAFAALPKQQQATVDDLEKRTFAFFVDSANKANGLIPDHWPDDHQGDYFSSIASVGFGLTAYGIGVERGWMSRGDAVRRTLTTLKFFHDAPQGAAIDATGYHGFFYHFLDMNTGKRYGPRSWVELSTVDTTLLLGGVLFAQSYYDRDTRDEKEIRRLADEIYRAVDWQWASPRAPLVAMGWSPEAEFIHADWQGWTAWTQGYDATWGEFQGQTHLGFAPLFGHQYSHVWIDFRGIRDDYMRRHDLDYFENSRRATMAQREYAIHNPMQWTGYGSDIWGLTASNGPRKPLAPGEVNRYAGDAKTFYGYVARGAGLFHTIDDGTIAPTAAAASIAFAPGIAIPAIEAMQRLGDAVYTRYGFIDAFNQSFTFTDRPLRSGRIVPSLGWVDNLYLGIDQGPIVAMAENFRSDLVWRVMRKNIYIRDGLRRAGFTGGWLDADAAPSPGRKSLKRP